MTKILVGRRVQPAAATLLLANLLIAVTLIPGSPWHPQFHEAHGDATFGGFLVHVTGLAAAISVVMFCWAWWGRRGRLLDHALQLSTVIWLVTAGIGWAMQVAWDRVLFSLCFALLAAGSAWLEESRASCGAQ